MTLLRYLFIVSLLAGSVFGQVKVRTSMPEGDIYLGETFSFYVIVDGASSVPDPEVYAPDGLEVRLVGGVASEEDGQPRYAFTFEAVAMESGGMMIPEIDLLVAGSGYVTEEVFFSVKAPEPTDKMNLEVALSHESCYVGEPVLMTVSWTTELSLNGVSALDLRLPVLTDHRFDIFETVDAVKATDEGSIGLPVWNARVIAKYEEVGTAEVPKTRISFQKVLVPKVTDGVVVAPSTLLCSFTEPKEARFRGARYPSYFNNDFFAKSSGGTYQRLLVSAPSIALEVKALPLDQPDGFDGLIGAFELETKASPDVLTTAEAITLELTATGHPFPQTLELPPLMTRGALPHSFEIPEERAPGKIVGESKLYRQSLRPRRAHLPEVPAISFSFFDPSTGKFGVAEAGAIPITVSEAERVSAFDASFSSGAALRNIVEEKPGGIHHNHAGDKLLEHHKATMGITEKGGFWWTLVLVPIEVFSLFCFWWKWKRFKEDDPVGYRAKKAFRVFKESSEAGDLESTRRYLAERQKMNPEAVVTPELIAGLSSAGVEAGIVSELKMYLEGDDTRKYSTQGEGQSKVSREQVVEWVQEIERRMK